MKNTQTVLSVVCTSSENWMISKNLSCSRRGLRILPYKIWTSANKSHKILTIKK